jgi:hypothetical protein
MNKLSYRIGQWSATLLLITLAIWILSFAAIAIRSPLFFWSNLSDYMVHYRSTGHFYQHLAYLFMLIAGPAYLLIINSYYEYATDDRRVLVRISLLFALGFTLLSGLHYFVQLSAVRFNLAGEPNEGLELFLQANPHSIMTAIDMLGWTLFLGLSSLFMVPVFSGEKSHRLLRYAFCLNGLSCLMAGVGYVLQIDALTFICINLLTGGALMTISIASVRLFRRQQN